MFYPKVTYGNRNKCFIDLDIVLFMFMWPFIFVIVCGLSEWKPICARFSPFVLYKYIYIYTKMYISLLEFQFSGREGWDPINRIKLRHIFVSVPSQDFQRHISLFPFFVYTELR